MKILTYIHVMMTCFAVLFSKSSAITFAVYFRNNFGDGTQLRISFKDASPNQPQTSRRSFPSSLVKPGKDTLFLFDVADGVEERFVYKSTVKWTETNGKVIIQTFVAFDNDPRATIPNVVYISRENRVLFFWSLRRNGRFLKNERQEEKHKGYWSTSIGRVWEVCFTNRREDRREIEIVSMEDPERWSELPSITRAKLKYEKMKELEFNEDDRQIRYVCTVKWQDEDQMEIVKSFVLFFNSTQSTALTIDPIRIIYQLKSLGIYEPNNKEPKLLWSTDESRPVHNTSKTLLLPHTLMN